MAYRGETVPFSDGIRRSSRKSLPRSLLAPRVDLSEKVVEATKAVESVDTGAMSGVYL